MESLLEKAESHRRHSRFGAAQKVYRSILRKPGLAGEEKAEALLGLADVERIQGYFPQALGHYRQAGNLLRGLDPVSEMDARAGWALAARASGKPLAALRELRKTLAFYLKTRDRHGQAFAHWALGGTLRIAGRMREGLRELRTALAMFKKLRDPEGTAYTCCALGGLYRMLGDYGNSGRYYREANRLMRRRQDTFGIAYSYCGLGNVERMAGRFQDSLPYYKKAERLYGKIGDRVSYAYTLWSIGTAYKMLGLYPKAHWAFDKADNLFKKTGDTRGRIYTLLGFAEIEYLKNRFRKSLINYFSAAEKLANKNIYTWEKLHVKSLLQLFIFCGFEKIKNAWGKEKEKKLENLLKKVLHSISRKYQKSGSRFHPTFPPVNWP